MSFTQSCLEGGYGNRTCISVSVCLYTWLTQLPLKCAATDGWKRANTISTRHTNAYRDANKLKCSPISMVHVVSMIQYVVLSLAVEILRERSRTRLVVKPALPAPANGSTVSITFAHVWLDTFLFTTECLSLSLSLSTVESGAVVAGVSLLAVVLIAVTGALMH